MTKESLKENIRRIVDCYNIRFIGENCREWAENHGFNKVDRRRSTVDDAYALWYDYSARVTFILYKRWFKDDYSASCRNEKLEIVMRKLGGNYIVIARNNENRMIEIDRTGYECHYDYEGLKALMNEYPDLFSILGVRE